MHWLTDVSLAVFNEDLYLTIFMTILLYQCWALTRLSQFVRIYVNKK